MTIVAKTALEMVQGDSEDFLVTVKDDAVPAVVIDLSKAVDDTAGRPAILRMAVKEDVLDANPLALVFKLSYFADQIQILPQIGGAIGTARVLFDKPDTETIDPGVYPWDLEVTRQDVLRTGASAGTIAVTTGSIVVAGTATALLNAKVGDVLQVLSGAANLLKPVKITKIVSAVSLEIEAALFATEAGLTFEIRRGKHKTAARGDFTIAAGTVAL